MDKYAVIGNPINHSKSPQIHASFAQQTGEVLRYEALSSPVDKFTDTVTAFIKNGAKGVNVTVPFKQEAFEIANELSDYATNAGAVNTLVFQDDGSILGTNTDGIGLVRDLVENNGTTIKNKRILILGAGGAVRGVLQPLLDEKPKQIFIANRTAERATELVDDMQKLIMQDDHDCELNAGGFSEIKGKYDLIINGTAASLEGVMPPIAESCLAANAHCYDMMYGSQATAFENWSEEQGADKIMNGLGMLVEQAAESFFIWRGKMPDTKPVLEAMRLSLAKQADE